MSKLIGSAILAAALVLSACGKSKDAPADKPAAKPAAAPAPVAVPPAAVPSTPPAAAPPAPEAPPAAAVPAAPAAPAAAIASDEEYVTKGTAMATKLIDVFKADGTDCEKIATDIEALQADPTVAAVTAYEKANPKVKKLIDKANPDLEKQFEAAAMPALKACMNNKRLEAAFAKFE